MRDRSRRSGTESARDEGAGSEIAESAATPVCGTSRGSGSGSIFGDFEGRPPIRPVQEVRMVTNTPVGVLRAIVILPSCLDVTVVHGLLRQTSTCRHRGCNEPCHCEL